MKKLVVYYSRTGTTKKVASEIASRLKCGIEEIIDIKNRSGPIGWINAGRDGMKKILTDINHIKKNPADYDLVIIGTPIWAGNVSSPIRTYLVQNKSKLKKVAFFATLGGDSADNTLSEMQAACLKPPIATLSLKTAEVNQNTHSAKLREFVDKLRAM